MRSLLRTPYRDRLEGVVLIQIMCQLSPVHSPPVHSSRMDPFVGLFQPVVGLLQQRGAAAPTPPRGSMLHADREIAHLLGGRVFGRLPLLPLRDSVSLLSLFVPLFEELCLLVNGGLRRIS